MKNSRKKALSDIAAAMSETGQNDKTDTSAGSLQDIIAAAFSEPNESATGKCSGTLPTAEKMWRCCGGGRGQLQGSGHRPYICP